MIFDDLLYDLSGSPSFRSIRIFTGLRPDGRTPKFRPGWAPNRAMHELHRRFLTVLRVAARRHPRLTSLRHYSTSGERGDSAVRNVARHRDNRYFLVFDIKDAFPSIDSYRLIMTLCQVFDEDSDSFERPFRRYFLDQSSGLVVGGPASLFIFNVFCAMRVDPTIAGLAGAHGLTYTRYVDDLIVSHPSEPIGKPLGRRCHQALTRAGFELNDQKCRYLDVHKKAIVINGVGLDRGGRLFTTRGFTSKLYGLLNWLLRSPTRGSEYEDAFQVAKGMMSVVRYIARVNGQPLNRTEQKLFERYQELIQRRGNS